MNRQRHEKFLRLWPKFFGHAELPVAFWYGNDPGSARPARTIFGHSCLINDLVRVRRGQSLAFNEKSVACDGGKRYLGFSDVMRPGFEFFLSCGIPGKLAGERYKKSPEIVRRMQRHLIPLAAGGRYVVFKRWDKLAEEDRPEVVVFFAVPDVLAGIFTLFSFAEAEPVRVVAPFAAGCGSIVYYPYLEKDKAEPRGIIGLFDPSARPGAEADVLTFALPLKKFSAMVDDMEESFLITPTWKKIRRRIDKRFPSVKGKA